MGLNLFCSSSGLETPAPNLPNPDPKRFRVEEWERIGWFLLVKVHYPNCTNFEGRKILVFQNLSIPMLLEQGAIDPHFSDSKEYHHPIARFIPTNEGWEMAKKFCRA